MEGNPEYVLWILEFPNTGRMSIAVYKKGIAPLIREACVYRVGGEIGVIKKSFHDLLCVAQLAGERADRYSLRVTLDRESILAVVPKWENVI